IQHPLYDAFGAIMEKRAARAHLGLPEGEKLILFFGFIRKYKGLDLLLEAMSDTRIREAGIKLLIAGEFYEGEALYRDKIRELGIEKSLVLRTDFIADAEVKYYLCAADAVIQPYRNATQSGVTPLAYHFEKPMVVTNVGGLPALVPHERSGLVCEPNPGAIAEAILRFYQLGEAFFIPHLRTEKLKYSWSNLTKAIFELSDSAKPG
ncbi:MAG TPA: glycosyltransferase, partial [Flavisolibacter sp.]